MHCSVFKPSVSWWQFCRNELTTLQSLYIVPEFMWGINDRTSHKAHWKIITHSMGWKCIYFYTLCFIGFQRGLAYLANNAWHFFFSLQEVSISVSVCSYAPLLNLHCHTAALQDWWQGLRMACVCLLGFKNIHSRIGFRVNIRRLSFKFWLPTRLWQQKNAHQMQPYF